MVFSAENGELRKETRSFESGSGETPLLRSQDSSAISNASVLRAKISLTSPSVQSVAQDSRVNKILIPVPKGARRKLYLRHDGTLNVSLDSDDFTYGKLPVASAFRRTGWIVCPQTDVTPACFHSWNYPTKRMSRVDICFFNAEILETRRRGELLT